MTTPRAFTLIEAMAALVIASVIIGGATGAVMTITKILADTSKKTSTWDHAKRLEEFLVAKAQVAGGGLLRPHMALFVENAATAAPPAGMGCRPIVGMSSCAAELADRLTIVERVVGIATCPVTAMTASTLSIGAGSAACCLSDLPAPGTQLEGRQVIVVDGAGNATSLFTTTRTGCTLAYLPGQVSGLIGTSTPASLGTGLTLIAADPQTFYVDRTTHSLRRWRDADGGLDVDVDEVSVVSDAVYDLQAAIGYDSAPEDGRVSNADSTTDECLFNVAGDPSKPGAAGTFLTVTPSQLRIVEIGLIVGNAAEVSGGNTVAMLDGPARKQTSPRVYLIGTSSRAFLRNLNIFTQ